MTFLCSLALIACSREEWMDPSGKKEGEAVFALQRADYEGEESFSRLAGGYDRVVFYVVDEAGYVVDNLKGVYDAATSEIHIEGLQEGDYTLLVLGIEGDAGRDGASIRRISHTADPWLVFPSQSPKPLEADYFYSRTSFSVSRIPGAAGTETIVSAPRQIVQRRIAGRADFSFAFHNPYVRTAVVHKEVKWEKASFYTSLSAGGSLSGVAEMRLPVLPLDEAASFRLLPLCGDVPLQGEISLSTRNYRGHQVEQSYGFRIDSLGSNRIYQVHTPVVHPDDEAGVMFLTPEAYAEGNHAEILQDGERKEVYTDVAQRSFNTSQPLQVSMTDDGRLHVRFYSPRKLEGVLVRARFPSVSDEYIDLAYFDTVPAFADFYGKVPLFSSARMYRTASGKWIQVPQQPLILASEVSFEVLSDDAYWEKLQAIRHGWNVSFDLYGGNPDLPDGGPAGNWMGIRPVHCREAVAFFLNFTYMIDMQEHEDILRANEDRLYGNGGVTDKVTAETVLKQMRQPRSLRVGLVYSGNNVYGLGGGNVFGAYQGAWLNHYTSTYACEVMFHELGHVMGYSHDSSFTYGPWAQELMNRFYVEHLYLMPIDSPDYLQSGQNPNLYK